MLTLPLQGVWTEADPCSLCPSSPSHAYPHLLPSFSSSLSLLSFLFSILWVTKRLDAFTRALIEKFLMSKPHDGRQPQYFGSYNTILNTYNNHSCSNLGYVIYALWPKSSFVYFSVYVLYTMFFLFQ